jgi:hypothetical protein
VTHPYPYWRELMERRERERQEELVRRERGDRERDKLGPVEPVTDDEDPQAR